MNFKDQLDKALNEHARGEMPVKTPTRTPTKPKHAPSRPDKYSPRPGPEPKPKAEVAPTKTPTPTRTPTPTKRPSRPDKYSPRPGPEPKPKAHMIVVEADEAHPANVKFWKDLPKGSHKFAKHPIMAVYGDKLSKESWQKTRDRLDKIGIGEVSQPELMQIFQQIIQIEAQHKPELQNLAIKLVSELWGFPKDRLRAFLTSSFDVQGDDEGDDNADAWKVDEIDDDMQKEIAKRTTMNTMTQGVAVHNMMEIHHLVRAELQKIDQNLIKYYDHIAAGSTNIYWMIDIARMMEMLVGSVAGSSSIKFEEQGPAVVAKAYIFPILVQELIKGVMEILTYHQFGEMDPQRAGMIIKHADKLEDEPWEIQVGPALWSRFVNVAAPLAKQANLTIADVVAALSVQPPDDVHKIIMLVLDDNSAEATEILKNLVAEPREFEVSEYEDGESDVPDLDEPEDYDSSEDWKK